MNNNEIDINLENRVVELQKQIESLSKLIFENKESKKFTPDAETAYEKVYETMQRFVNDCSQHGNRLYVRFDTDEYARTYAIIDNVDVILNDEMKSIDIRFTYSFGVNIEYSRERPDLIDMASVFRDERRHANNIVFNIPINFDSWVKNEFSTWTNNCNESMSFQKIDVNEFHRAYETAIDVIASSQAYTEYCYQCHETDFEKFKSKQ